MRIYVERGKKRKGEERQEGRGRKMRIYVETGKKRKGVERQEGRGIKVREKGRNRKL
jgi:hypothetical protein